MSKKVKTARGQILDMASLSARNEKVRAVGNILMNARGDRLNQDGSIRYTAEEIARLSHDIKEPPQQTSVSEPKPIKPTPPQPVAEQKPVQPENQPIPEDPEAVSKITRTREDGTKYVEIEYDDGSIETQELEE